MHSSVQTLLEPTHKAETIGEARDRLGDLLELNGPAATAVTLRVLADADFAEKLVAVRKFPEWRDRLLSDPANSAYEPMDQPSDESEVNARPVMSTVALVKKSSIALTAMERIRLPKDSASHRRAEKSGLHGLRSANRSA